MNIKHSGNFLEVSKRLSALEEKVFGSSRAKVESKPKPDTDVESEKPAKKK